MADHDNKCEQLVLTAASPTCACWHRARIAALEASLAAAERDVGRYRNVRQHGAKLLRMSKEQYDSQVDAAIDAALATKERK